MGMCPLTRCESAWHPAGPAIHLGTSGEWTFVRSEIVDDVQGLTDDR
jgi:hypothetical protein